MIIVLFSHCQFKKYIHFQTRIMVEGLILTDVTTSIKVTDAFSCSVWIDDSCL